jgi:hypothetical protein
MGSFDQAKAYAQQEETFFDDGREIELLHFVYSHPKIEQIRGSPKDVLAAIDEFGRTKKYLMNVGEDKGRIVCDLIAEVKPKTMVCEIALSRLSDCLMLRTGRARWSRWLLLHSICRCSTESWW